MSNISTDQPEIDDVNQALQNLAIYGDESLAHELASADNSTYTPESVPIPTKDINEAIVGNNTHALLVGNQTGSKACLEMQGADGKKRIGLLKFLETAHPNLKRDTVLKLYSHIKQIEQMVFEARNPGRQYTGQVNFEIVNLTFVLECEIVKEQLRIKCQTLKPNSAQEYYAAFANIVLNHYAYTTDEKLQELYTHCREKQQQLMKCDRLLRDEKRKNNQPDPKVFNGSQVLMNEELLKQLYSESSPQGKILQLLLLDPKLAARNELRMLRVVTAGPFFYPNFIVLKTTDNGDRFAEANFTKFKTDDSFTRKNIKLENPELLELLFEHHSNYGSDRPLFSDSNGNAIDGDNQTSSFTKMVNRHFQPICKKPAKGEKPSDFKIDTTLIRKFLASKDTKEILQAQQFINDKVIPFAHGGHNDLGVHAEYLFELPSPE